MEKTLEQEFEEYKERHKYEMIASALILCEDEGIYEEKLLGDYELSYLKGADRAFDVVDDLFDRANNDDEGELYDKIYEMCWNRIRNRIRDDKSYRLDEVYDEN